jgi:TonB-linked SusC/RagA family outer membrane protein
MNFKFIKNSVHSYRGLLRTIMKSFVFLFCTLSFALGPKKGFSQDAKITIEKDKEISIGEVFKLINEQTEYTFVYRNNVLKDAPKLQLKKGVIKASALLKQCLSPINLTYEFTKNNTILVKKMKINEIDSQENKKEKEVKIKITGVVTGEAGVPLPGASVLEKGTSNGVSTDFDGNYTISVTDENAILVAAYIGYVSKEVSILGKTEINFTLKEDAAKLDEIVIIGYGSVAKKDLTGAVGVVDNINERPVTSTAAGLQGSVSGVTISSTGGDPTAQPNVQIRGLGTVNNESPLYVVDGVPYFGGPINPFDIASISILKDASSQAIYGVRAAGGVILITTKKGKNGKLSFNFNSFNSMITAKQPKALSAADRVKYLTQAGFDTTSNPVEYSTVDRTNWVDEIFRKGVVKNYDLGVRGGNEKNTFASSIGYTKTEGTLINTNADRLTFRLSSSFKVNDKLKIGENIYYTKTSGNSVFTGTTDKNGGQSYNGIIAQAIKTNPSIAVYDADGNYNDLLSVSTINPVSTLNRLDIEDVNQDFFANIYFDYNILDNLILKSSFGINSKTRNFQQFNPKSPEVSKTRTDQNSLDFLTGEQQDWSLETTLSYNETFKDIHNLTLLAGNTLQRFQSTLFSITGRDFSSELPNLRQLINATSWTKPLTTFNSNSLVSYFGRAIYSYDQKYILTASLRADGTSKLPSAASDNTWGTFPSVAVAWRMSDENFLKESETISNLKLRASWGIIGNINSLDNYPTDIRLASVNTILGADDNNFLSGLALDGRSNSNIKWELTKSLNFGTDISLANGLSLTGDYFIKTTDDMLLRLQGSTLEGIGQFPFVNGGSVENKGFELSLNYQKTKGDFTYNLSGNLSKIDNKLTAVSNDSAIPHIDGYNVASHTPLLTEVGQSLFSFYVLETAGIFQTDAEATAYTAQPNAVAGDLKFIDHNNDGRITDEDRVTRGSAFPDITYAFNADFNYKNFDMRIFLQGVSGSSAYNGFKLTTVYPNQTSVGPEANLSADAIDTWSPTNAGSSNFRLGGAGDNLRPSDFWIEDTSYLRLKNVTVGYTFPEIKGISRLRIYAAGENLFTITDYSGLDPEVGNRGLDGGQYPTATTFSIGLNVGF